MKHTPGPWLKGTFPEQHPPFIAIYGKETGAACIASIWAADGGAKLSDKDRANARIITAAPELLESLRKALGAHQIRYDLAVRLGVQPPSAESWVSEARTLVEKLEA